MFRLSRQCALLWCLTGIFASIASQIVLAEAGANSPADHSNDIQSQSRSSLPTGSSADRVGHTTVSTQAISTQDVSEAFSARHDSIPHPRKVLGSRGTSTSHPLDPAIQLMQICRNRFAAVFDYEARIVQQERVGKSLLPPQDLLAKFRTHPHSIYLKWKSPEAGREAIYVEGRDEGKLLVHAAGVKKAFLGVNRIDPEGSQAKRETRYSVTEGGIGHTIDKLLTRWEYERRFDETDVSITSVKINGRPCVLISAVHPRPDDGKFMFHTFRVYIDKENMLPIRTEAYGYPEKPGKEPGDLLESYTYLDLRLNPGLTDVDFSIANPAYEFSRF